MCAPGQSRLLDVVGDGRRRLRWKVRMLLKRKVPVRLSGGARPLGPLRGEDPTLAFGKSIDGEKGSAKIV